VKKWMAMATCLFVALVLVTGCGGKYDDVKKVNAEYVGMVEDYIADLDKADNKDDVVAAMDAFTADLEVLWPKMRALAEKYPELENEDELPEDLKETQKATEEVSAKMAGSFAKIMQYMSDPDVMAAQQRMAQIMMQK